MSTSPEVEDKYQVDSTFTVPNLAGVGPIAAMGEPVTDDLEAIYFDTADLRLARGRLTLRRRSGGSDEGWHLKLPSGTDREEVHRPLGRSRNVPRELAQLVRARTRGAALHPVARIRTRRTTHDLLDAEGAVLAQLADDDVNAERLGAGGDPVAPLAWREVEVELVAGDKHLLSAVRRKLRASGARPAATPSKLAHVLGERLTASEEPLPLEGRLSPRSPAGEVIRRYLAQQTEVMLAWDLHVRLSEPDAVHKMRVSVRRIRSTLGSYRRLLDEPRARELERRLKEIAAELGVVRDAEVLQERLLAEVAEQPVELVLGPVQRHIVERLGSAEHSGRTALMQTLAGDDYANLLDELLDFVRTGITAGSAASRRARAVLPKLVARRYRKLARRVKVASRADGDAAATALHEARKAAKQVRYAADAVEPAFGSDAAALASQAKKVQEVLGEHQDSVMATAALRELGLAAHAEPGETAFTYGLLVGVEQARGAAARAKFRHIWKRASRRRYRSWLR